ncbi:fatty acyl-CoA reductase 8-like [Cicer arietinum]|uniref:Fatty acyl-CoA reductase n=1 Tax=Cicer arietinum TaxID=3827 RepID=A0A1S2XL45_CICAR|nr:fatty acyl-CoA reductase 8-like [Cicer arietinum]
MELGDIPKYFAGKTILVTGATGFLGKVFLEKILRVQPNIKKLYLLVRSSNTHLATQRLHFEVFKKDLFRLQRDEKGENFGTFISEKVVVVVGDVSLEMLGVKDAKMREDMLKEINIIVHSAATTRFDERFDIAMATNTMGAFNVLSFAKNCLKLEILLHVSTAYVYGQMKGLISEKPFFMGQTLKGSSTLDIELEKKLIENKLSELEAQKADEQTIDMVMKKFGIVRANLHGWPNTYAFTKAMGEMLVANMKDLPLIIIRPTVVTSTHFEPFPGWVDDVRALNFIIDGYGKGIIRSFVGVPETVLDIIPVDMVVNSMIVAMVARSKNLCTNLIYNISSSLRNPINFSDVLDNTYCYFTKNPWINKNGKPVLIAKKMALFSTSMDEFDPNKGSKMESAIELFRPYTIFEGIFDDQNVENLRMVAKRAIDEGFDFDPRNINWKNYLMNVYIPGVMKYSMRSKM